MKIRALNEPNSTHDSSSNDSSSEENNQNGNAKQQTALSKEAFEEQCFEKYKKALLAIQESQEDEARDLLDNLNDDIDEELDELFSSSKASNVDPADCLSTLKQLKFSVLKNLGNLVNDSIDHYVDALDLDPSDISLWIKAGDRCTNLGNFSFARYCYEQALKINSSNWVAIDRLLEIYYILHLPFELHDICLRALKLNGSHQKAHLLLQEAKKLQPTFTSDSTNQRSTNNNQKVNGHSNNVASTSSDNNSDDQITNTIVLKLDELKRKRRFRIQDELLKFKKARLGITLDTARTQSLASFGNYFIKIYERFAKQGLTRNSVIDITLNNSLSFSQQFGHNANNNNSITTTNNSQSTATNNQNSNELQTGTSTSQDIDMVVIEGEGTSASDNEKSNNRNEPTINSNDEIVDQTTKSNSRNRLNQTFQKGSSLSFAAMLFPMDLGDKRRSSRNKSNQDDTFSFKMKFDEINELFPDCLKISAIEQVLQKRREEQQKNSAEKEKQVQEEAVLVETNLDPVREDIIIKDIIEDITDSVQSGGASFRNNIKLCDMFWLYLSKLAAKKQNALPEAYLKIYKFYRRLCPLPKGIFIEIGPNGITLDELWFTLTANEIEYQPHECSFLLRLLEQLQIYLDDSQHREFLVRLFLILGSKSNPKYLEVALENIEEDTKVYASNRKIFTRAYIKTLIDKTNEKLQQENENPDDSLEIINRLEPKSENEMSDREIASLCLAIKSAGLWQRGLDILNQRNDLNSDIIVETINECLMNGAVMDAILASKLCKDAISGQRPTTWTCLYRGWLGVLSVEQLNDDMEIEKLNKFFELGHQTLGKKNCCTADKGEFLMLYVAHLLEWEHFEERDLLGPLNCLFGYPNKKPASVVGHKAPKVPILWEYAEIIYPYLVPDDQPTYMSLLRKVGITNELEPLFKEIASAVPPELNPSEHVKIIEDFINEGQPLVEIEQTKNDVTKDLYYFLADYYFKNKDFSKAKQFYNYDLVINPDRFDSWAASGLIRANGIDKALSEGTISEAKDMIEGPFYELANSAINCFDQATKLNPTEPKATLWIEYGNLTYNLASLASRICKYESFECDMDGKEYFVSEELQTRHKHLYELAKDCFESANTLCHSEEVWLHYYMLGKIYEKVDVFKALEYYYKADAHLFLEGASYPKKISYHNPPELAYEAMEVHYRIHACALKFMLNFPDTNQDQVNLLKSFLLNAQRSPFVTMEGINNPTKHLNSAIDRDVGYLLDDVIDAVCTEAQFEEVIFMCLHGIKRCLVRCDKNFKALYRLSFYYQKIADSKLAQDILMVKELQTDDRVALFTAMNPHLPEFRAAPPDLKGIDTLFKDRKMGNLFFNIWRIPVEEVDRPGCFEHWMFKCTVLLIESSIKLRDYSTLTLIAFQLSRQPETSKKYLQDKTRLLLSRYAVVKIIQEIQNSISNAEDLNSKRILINEGMTVTDRFIKSNVFPDKMRQLYEQLQSQAMAIYSYESYNQ